jgi:hypothetical protein
MRVWTADSTAPPEVVWDLVVRPDQWSRWSPHVRGAWALGDPEVEPGAHGAARLLGIFPVPARITGKREREWTWQVGLVQMTHRVRERPGGSRAEIELHAPLERLVALTYGPVIQFTLERLCREAQSNAATSR